MGAAGLACKPPQAAVCECWEPLESAVPIEAAREYTDYASTPNVHGDQEPRTFVEEHDPAPPPQPRESERSSAAGPTRQVETGSRHSTARQRLRGAVVAVKAANRLSKTVRFNQESLSEVIVFEVQTSIGSETHRGLQLGDNVVWADCDDDVPKGSVGEVAGLSGQDIVQVTFPTGTWDFKASELCHQESWAAKLVRETLKKAELLMHELRVLEAESALAEVLERLQGTLNAEKKAAKTPLEGPPQGGAAQSISSPRSPGQRRAFLLSASECSECAAAIKRLQKAVVYGEVVRRAGQYDAFGRTLMPDGFRLASSGPAGQFWVRKDPGSSNRYEYKLVCDLGDAALPTCLAYGHELDLRHKYESRLLEKPHYVGPVEPLLCVTRTLLGVLALRIELIVEVFRWFNLHYGFYGESIRSHFPEEGRSMPERAWRTCRVSLACQNLWIPKGNGEKGTVAVLLMRVDTGAKLGKWLLSTFIKQVASAHAKDLRGHITRVQDPNGPYGERLRQDRLGFYRELGKVEAAAAKRRQSVSVANLPGVDILRRRGRLPADFS